MRLNYRYNFNKKLKYERVNLFRKLKLKLDLNDLNMNKDYITDAYYSR
jgi:hypothetical protein